MSYISSFTSVQLQDIIKKYIINYDKSLNCKIKIITTSYMKESLIFNDYFVEEHLLCENNLRQQDLLLITNKYSISKKEYLILNPLNKLYLYNGNKVYFYSGKMDLSKIKKKFINTKINNTILEILYKENLFDELNYHETFYNNSFPLKDIKENIENYILKYRNIL